MANWKDTILLYSKAHHWWRKKLQRARAGVDYIKVNFQTDNFDKVINVLAQLADIDHAFYVGSAPMYTASLVMAMLCMQSCV